MNGIHFNPTTTVVVGAGTVFAIAVTYVSYEIISLYVAGSKKRSIMKKIPDNEQGIFGEVFKFPGLNEAGLEYISEKLKIFPLWRSIWMTKFFPIISVHHPETVKVILKTSQPKPLKPGTPYYFGLEWLGLGLLFADGKRWARSRRLLTPAFHFEILKPYMKVNNNSADILLAKMERCNKSGKSFEFTTNISQCTLDIMLRCAMSYENTIQEEGQSNPYVQAVNELCELWTTRSMKPWLYPDFIYYLTPNGRKFMKLCKYVHNITDEIIQKRKQILHDQGEKALKGRGRYQDFLDILLLARDDKGQGMNDYDMRCEVDTFLFEGHDTTSSAMTWIIYSLAVHPEYQDTCRREIDDMLEGRDTDEIFWEDLEKLEITTRCIKEALRLHSPVPAIMRVLNEPLTIKGVTLPKSCVIEIPLWSLHNNPHVWEKPEIYDPERFTPENSKNRDPYAFCPFSAGPRNCIGQTFAMDELKVLTARILRKFEVSLDDSVLVSRKMSIVMRTENGMYLKLKARKFDS